LKWAIVIPLALALSACGAAQPTMNSGYGGWWPAGLGYPPVTDQALNAACSVTVYGPTLPRNASDMVDRNAGFGVSWIQRYGGEASCAAPVRTKSLLIAEEVLGRDGTWWTIAGSTFTINSAKHELLRAMRARPADAGHIYRAVAHAVLVLPHQHSRCPANNACSQTVLATAVSQPVPAQYP
jgi:hypothetical protein